MSSHTKGKGKGVVTRDGQNYTSNIQYINIKSNQSEIGCFYKGLNTEGRYAVNLKSDKKVLTIEYIFNYNGYS